MKVVIMKVLVFLLLLTLCLSATYKTEKYYSLDTTCSNYFTSWLVIEVATCTPTVTCENLNNNAGRITTCSTLLPTFPDGWVKFYAYQTLDCSGPVAITGAPLATCTGYWVGSAVKVNCVGSACRVWNCAMALSSCDGCPSQDTNGIDVCITGNPTSGYPMLAFKISPPPFTTTATTLSSTTAPVNNTNTTIPAQASTMFVSFGLLFFLALIAIIL